MDWSDASRAAVLGARTGTPHRLRQPDRSVEIRGRLFSRTTPCWPIWGGAVSLSNCRARHAEIRWSMAGATIPPRTKRLLSGSGMLPKLPCDYHPFGLFTPLREVI